MNWLPSLFRRKADVPLWTGRVLPAGNFQALLNSPDLPADTSYAEINSAALPQFHDWFRAKLWDLGLVKWDPKQDCDDFANLYADFMQLRFYLAQWERGTLPDAQSLAVARWWYRPDDSPYNHAINAVATERGLLFVEPQTGSVITLSPTEIQSCFRRIF